MQNLKTTIKSFLEDKQSQKIKWIFFTGLILFFLIGNFLTPYLVDDYTKCHFRGLGLFKAIITSISNSQKNSVNVGGFVFYNLWGILQRLSFNYSKWVFNLINSLHFSLFLFAFYYLIDKYVKNHIFTIILCFFTLILIPAPTQTLFWQTGVTAYFWPLTWSFILLLIYETSHAKNKILYYFIVPLLSYFCGAAHGSLGGVILIVCIGYIITWKIAEQKKIPFWSILSILAVLMGIAAMVFSPSNALRAETCGQGIYFSSGVFFQAINLLRFEGFFIGLLLSSLFCNWLYSPNHRKKEFILAFFYALAALSGRAALFIVPASPRTSLFFPCFAVISIAYSMTSIVNARQLKPVLTGSLLIVAFMFVVRFGSIYSDAAKVNKAFDFREKQIILDKSLGKDKITVSDFSNWNFYRRFTDNLSDLGDSAEDWQNEGMARFYGVKAIYSEPYE